MIPVPMRVKHNPPDSWGDCFRACIASVLNLGSRDVPHFMDGDPPEDQWQKVVERWMNAHGYTYIEVPFMSTDGVSFSEDKGLHAVLKTIAVNNPNVYYMLAGNSPAGSHSVVCFNDEIVHDPAGREPGDQIVGPNEDGIYWIGFIGAGVAKERL